MAGPGFTNLTVADGFPVHHIQHTALDGRLGCNRAATPWRIVVDYGGADIAKPLHVGHLRAAIIGESPKRIARFLVHKVLGDVHLGDRGLPLGMVISELGRRRPELPYADPRYSGPNPDEPPITMADLEEIYPAVSAAAEQDLAVVETARQAGGLRRERKVGAPERSFCGTM